MKYDFEILQTRSNYSFMPFKYAMENGFCRSDYIRFYGGSTHAETVNEALEGLFVQFNMNRPEDFKGHSLSVSDVVTLNGIPYYCDSFGWSEIPKDRWNA